MHIVHIFELRSLYVTAVWEVHAPSEGRLSLRNGRLAVAIIRAKKKEASLTVQRCVSHFSISSAVRLQLQWPSV